MSKDKRKSMTDQERAYLIRNRLEAKGMQPLPIDHNATLTMDQLAEALYEGRPHLANLAEKLARQHSPATALCFYQMQGEGVKAFWRDIASQLIEHASQWEENEGSCCILSDKENKRLDKKYF